MEKEDPRIAGMRKNLPKLDKISKELLMLAIDERVPAYAVVLLNKDMKKYPDVADVLDLTKLPDEEAFAICLVHIGKGTQDILDCLHRLSIEFGRKSVGMREDGTIIHSELEENDDAGI